MPASPSGGLQDRSLPKRFASKSRSSKETAETFFETSVRCTAPDVRDEALHLDEVLRAQHGLQRIDVSEPRGADIDPFVGVRALPRATVASSSCAASRHPAVRSTVSHWSWPRRRATFPWRGPSALSAVGRTNWGSPYGTGRSAHRRHESGGRGQKVVGRGECPARERGSGLQGPVLRQRACF